MTRDIEIALKEKSAEASRKADAAAAQAASAIAEGKARTAATIARIEVSFRTPCSLAEISTNCVPV